MTGWREQGHPSAKRRGDGCRILAKQDRLPVRRRGPGSQPLSQAMQPVVGRLQVAIYPVRCGAGREEGFPVDLVAIQLFEGFDTQVNNEGEAKKKNGQHHREGADNVESFSHGRPPRVWCKDSDAERQGRHWLVFIEHTPSKDTQSQGRPFPQENPRYTFHGAIECVDLLHIISDSYFLGRIAQYLREATLICSHLQEEFRFLARPGDAGLARSKPRSHNARSQKALNYKEGIGRTGHQDTRARTGDFPFPFRFRNQEGPAAQATGPFVRPDSDAQRKSSIVRWWSMRASEGRSAL